MGQSMSPPAIDAFVDTLTQMVMDLRKFQYNCDDIFVLSEQETNDPDFVCDDENVEVNQMPLRYVMHWWCDGNADSSGNVHVPQQTVQHAFETYNGKPVQHTSDAAWDFAREDASTSRIPVTIDDQAEQLIVTIMNNSIQPVIRMPCPATGVDADGDGFYAGDDCDDNMAHLPVHPKFTMASTKTVTTPTGED